MELRNRRGGITPAEGCMFGAVALFVILLLAILYIAFMRFRNPPPPTPVTPPAAVGAVPAPAHGGGWSGTTRLMGWSARSPLSSATPADV